MKRVFKHFLLAFALVLTFVLFSGNSVQAATKPIRTFSDAPVKCSNSKGAFHGKFTQVYGKTQRLQGWVAADAPISDFTYEFEYLPGCTALGAIDSVSRPDVKKAYPSYKYCLGFEFSDVNALGWNTAYGKNGTLRIYAMIGGVKTLVGQYDVNSKDMITCSDFPITIAPDYGPFRGDVSMSQNPQLKLQGWVASKKASISTIYGQLWYQIPNSNIWGVYYLPMIVGFREDVKAAYPGYAYCVGYQLNPIYNNIIKKYLNGEYGNIYIYAVIDGQDCLVGTYDLVH